jgi:maltooligosyltrehalose trehalohydrolase
VHFRVWAPRRQQVDVVTEGAGTPAGPFALERDADGYFAGLVAGLEPGTRYRYRLDGEALRPDPASRFQPEGPHGPSEVVDPGAFRWSDVDWRGVHLAGQIVYEMHIGTFTPAGTWRAATAELPSLGEMGITLLEVMPVAEFPGAFGWGYDGVDLFAPFHGYGVPDDFRHFVNAAHRVGLGVMLDVVYNHLGPSGNYLRDFSPHYFSAEHATEWGDAINFDGESSPPVREFFLANARHWIEEYHLDGLRLDATQSIFDRSERHIVGEIAEIVRRTAAPRAAVIVGENEPQDTGLLRRRSDGGGALDALWNDDFHHAAVVALTGRDEAYYTDYRGRPQEFVSAAKYGFLYQGQRYQWQDQRRGTPTFGLAPERFVHYLENHDQVANSARGDRLHRLTSPGRWRALTALLLLGPQTPMLFQGQEFASTAPFLYFADHEPELAERVRAGRADFLEQFPSIALPDVSDALPDPADPRTFERCRLDPSQRVAHGRATDLHRDLIRLRRTDAAFAARQARDIDGAVLSDSAFLLRWLGAGDDRLLVVNLGRPLHFDPAPEPLLAPPERRRWRVIWSSDNPRYGGLGAPPVESDAGLWHVPGESATVFAPTPRDADA